MVDRDSLIARWAPTLNTQADLIYPDPDPEPDEPDDTAEEKTYSGVWVGLFLPPDAAQQLAVDDGEEPDELHLTLVMLAGDATTLPPTAEAQIVAVVAEWAQDQAPVAASVAGLGMFTANDPPVTYASIDAPALASARADLVARLERVGYPINLEHGFTPHVTLIYDDQRSLDVPILDLVFSTVTVGYAGEHTHIPLTGTPLIAEEAGERLQVLERPTRAPAVVESEPLDDHVRAFVADVNGKTLITGPATASFRDHTVEDIAANHLLWMHGRFVGATVPNRNGALWSAGDLQMARASVVNGPLNWLHESRHVIGTLAKADFVDITPATGRSGQGVQRAALTQPHITATAAIWRWIYPDEAFVIQQASELNQLWYSMECISQEVACAGPDGCGNTTSYSQYMSGAACAHVTQRASIRQFIKPVFLGGAVIVPPTRPGWGEADASVMKTAASLAEAAFEQAGQPEVTTSAWEQMMAQLVRFTQG